MSAPAHGRTHLVRDLPDGALTRDEVLARWPVLRQSDLSRFDDCELSAWFNMKFASGLTTHPMARGIIEHRVYAECLREMQRQQMDSIPVASAWAILEETLRQRNVAPQDRVRVPLREMPEIWSAVSKWAKETFSVEKILDIERRLTATVSYRVPDTGELIERKVTGQLDAMIMRGTDELIIPDWKGPQPLDARILTPRGWSTMGELAVGDEVIGSDGSATRVVAVHPQGRKQVYEIEFTDGSVTRCCDDHLWTVRRIGNGQKWFTQPLVIMRRDLERGVKPYWQVPAVAPIKFADQGPLPLDPYLLGLLLGDGGFPQESSVTITTADEEILEAVRNLLPDGMCINHVERYSWRLASLEQPNLLRRALSELGLLGCRAWEKHVPHRYLYASDPADRMALLRGLMDTDGFVSEKNQTSYCSASQQLAEDVQFLVRSLGGRATRKVWPKPGARDSHAVYFRSPACPFRLKRKADRWKLSVYSAMTRGMRKITPVGEQETQCITVAATDGLYVTDDFIVTHNSWGIPPKRDEDAQEPGLSYHGYFQQRFYALLAFLNFPSVNAVVLREFYQRRKEARPARVVRSELPRIQEEMSILVEAFDEAMMAGPPPKLTIEALEEHGHWKPQPGKHCGYCPQAAKCPLDDDYKDGGIRTRADAERAAAVYQVASAVRKRMKGLCEEWVDLHGPISVKYAKGRLVLGHRKVKNGTRFECFVPKDSDRPSTEEAFNPNVLEDAMRASVEELRKTKEAV